VLFFVGLALYLIGVILVRHSTVSPETLQLIPGVPSGETNLGPEGSHWDPGRNIWPHWSGRSKAGGVAPVLAVRWWWSHLRTLG